MREIWVALSRLGSRVFRNQVGSYKLADGRYITSGLGVGSPDLVGWHTITITPEMTGKRVAVFFAVEVKSKNGRVSELQNKYLQTIQNAGGIGIVAKSTQEAVGGIHEFIARLSSSERKPAP